MKLAHWSFWGSLIPMAKEQGNTLPAPQNNEVYVTVSTLDGGHLTLPEKFFITSADGDKSTTVPSLCFLIKHPSLGNNGRHTTNLLFDMGIARDLSSYTTSTQSHIAKRQPVITDPDCAASLRAGGIEPSTDIDIVIPSHVHWDHSGTPADFSQAKFFVGSGTLHVLRHGAGPYYPAESFQADLLPRMSTFEFSPSPSSGKDGVTIASSRQTGHQWRPFAGFPEALDLFGDGSVMVIDAPGHITGHVNLLVRIGKGRWIYLGGDCCHDARIWNGEKEIGMYDDGSGKQRSVHMDTEKARDHLRNVRKFLQANPEVEMVIAHDAKWKEKNRHKFLPGKL